jgi:hypothetical protein
MKYLSNYIEENQTKLFNKTGAFFAFGQDQFNKAKKKGINYVSLGSGLICPKDNVDRLLNDLDKIADKGRKQDIEENGKKKIIWREFSNHECQISMDPTDGIYALDGYGFTKDEILAEWKGYYSYCIENDLF